MQNNTTTTTTETLSKNTPCVPEIPQDDSKHPVNQYIIGEGGFAKVYDSTITVENVIFKCIPLHSFYESEISFLKKVRDIPGTVNFLNYFILKYHAYITMEKIPNAIDLQRFLNHHGPLSEHHLKHVLKQLINILLKCKNKNILHNDIKEENILIDPVSFEITLIDFGAAENWHDNDRHTYRGTTLFSCPEWRRFHFYTADQMTSWNIGLLTFGMLHQYSPIENIQDIDRFTENNLFAYSKTLPETISDSLRSFLFQCLDPDPAARLKLDDMLSTSWFHDKN